MQAKIQVRDDQFVYGEHLIGCVLCGKYVWCMRACATDSSTSITSDTNRQRQRLCRSAEFRLNRERCTIYTFKNIKNINYTQLIRINVMNNFICIHFNVFFSLFFEMFMILAWHGHWAYKSYNYWAHQTIDSDSSGLETVFFSLFTLTVNVQSNGFLFPIFNVSIFLFTSLYIIKKNY